MARIPQEEIERLKRDLSVERMARARGNEVKRHLDCDAFFDPDLLSTKSYRIPLLRKARLINIR
jgi:hypothetical protein